MIEKHNKEAFDKISRERKNLILEIGVEEFANKGFDGANINIIAKRAGISVGLMYKYFNTKEDLFLTCVNHGMEILDQVLREIMNSDEKLLKKAELLIRAIQSHSRQNANYIRLYNEITGEKNSANITLIAKEMEGASAKIYSSLIAKAKADGDIRQDCDPKLFAFFLDNILTSLQFSYTCEYYRERFKTFAGVDILEDDELVVEQLLKFIESAFTFSK